MSEYDPNTDPNWEYQGRTPQQVRVTQTTGSIAALALICLLLIVGAYYLVPHVLGR